MQRGDDIYLCMVRDKKKWNVVFSLRSARYSWASELGYTCLSKLTFKLKFCWVGINGQGFMIGL